MEENVSTRQVMPMEDHPAVLATSHTMYKIGEFFLIIVLDTYFDLQTFSNNKFHRRKIFFRLDINFYDIYSKK